MSSTCRCSRSVSFLRRRVSVLALGIVYGAIVALMQTDLKRLVAYSSVSHLGFVVLGTFAFTEQAMAGGVLQMVNHGLSTRALFLLVGMVYERTHTRDLTRMGGMMSVTPWLGGTFLFVALSSAGLPRLSGFVGEFLVILGTLARNVWFGAIDTGVVLAAMHLLVVPEDGAHGPVPEERRHHPDLSLRRGRGPRPCWPRSRGLRRCPAPARPDRAHDRSGRGGRRGARGRPAAGGSARRGGGRMTPELMQGR